MGVENYHVIELVGEGSFGMVYKGRHKLTGQGELFEILEDDKHLPEEQVQAIAKQLVRALRYLHSNRVIHRDMKPQNILIGAGSIVKPPFYTNSVYELIQHIVKDPVKYTDNMSSSSKNFLKGLLNKVHQNRLTWPALLEHPLVKETTEEVEDRETRSSTAAERGCIAAWRGEGNKIQTSGGLAFSSPVGKVTSPASSGDNSGISFQDDAQSNIPDSKAVNSSPNEGFPGFANEVKQSGCQLLDRLENNSHTVKGAKIIGQDNEALAHVLLPIKRCSQGSQNSSRDQDILTSNQSLRIISNLVAAGAITSSGLLDEIIHDILVYTTFIVSIKSSELNELRAKVGAPGFILCCLEYLELKDLGRPVALLAKMIGQRPLAVQLVGKALLDHSSLKEVILDVPIVSDLARMDKAFCFKKGTTIGALLYKEGIVGLLDSRATFVNPSTNKEQLRTSFKLFTISAKSNLFFLLCGDQDKCFCLASILVADVKFHERNGDLVTIDYLAIIAQMQLKQIFRLASPEERKSEFGGILIGWRADKNYQAYSIMSEEQEVKEPESLCDIKDLEGLREVQEKLVSGSGSIFANEIYDRLHGVNCEMSEELAKAAAVLMVHWSALNDVSTGDTTYVCIFRHQQNFNPDLSMERHEPLDVQLNDHTIKKRWLILMKIPIAEAGIYMDFESSMSARENVLCASLMLSKKRMNYYRILCRTPSHVQDLFAELTQNSDQSVGPFVPCKYRLGEVYINLSVALFTDDALQSIAKECRDELER